MEHHKKVGLSQKRKIGASPNENMFRYTHDDTKINHVLGRAQISRFLATNNAVFLFAPITFPTLFVTKKISSLILASVTQILLCHQPWSHHTFLFGVSKLVYILYTQPYPGSTCPKWHKPLISMVLSDIWIKMNLLIYDLWDSNYLFGTNLPNLLYLL